MDEEAFIIASWLYLVLYPQEGAQPYYGMFGRIIKALGEEYSFERWQDTRFQATHDDDR